MPQRVMSRSVVLLWLGLCWYPCPLLSPKMWGDVCGLCLSREPCWFLWSQLHPRALPRSISILQQESCLQSVLTSETMWKPMIHTPMALMDSKEQISYFGSDIDHYQSRVEDVYGRILWKMLPLSKLPLSPKQEAIKDNSQKLWKVWQS